MLERSFLTYEKQHKYSVYFALLDAVVDMDESFVLVLEFVVLLLWLLSLWWFLDDGIE